MNHVERELAVMEKLKEIVSIEECILEGNFYKGRFLGEQRQGRVEAGSEYSSHYEYRFYWRGRGIIKNTQTGEKIRFLFNTWNLLAGREWVGDTSPHNLEEELIRFKENHIRIRLKKEQLLNYTSILDLALLRMYNKAKEERDEEIIPTIYPIPISKKEAIILEEVPV